LLQVPKQVTLIHELVSRREVLKNSGYLMLAKLFVRLVSVPFLIYVAATLGPSMFGVFTFVMATVEMVSSLSDFGLSRYGTRVMVREEKDQARFAGILLTLQLFTSVLLAGLGLAVVLIADPSSPKLQVLLLGLLAVVISAFIYTSETIFTATKQFAASAVFSVVGRLVYLAAGFAALNQLCSPMRKPAVESLRVLFPEACFVMVFCC